MQDALASRTNFTSFRKTRMAPTPSGYLHLGNVFSFILTALLAEWYGATILLRIDDLDQQRVRPEYVQDIFDTLNFLELPWHEGPRDAGTFIREYSQLHRMPLYREALQQLQGNGHLFACDCSRSATHSQEVQSDYTGTCLYKALPTETPGVSWRLHTGAMPSLSFNSLFGSVAAIFPDEQQHFVVRKKDGFPAYQLASVVDDVSWGIDLVVRGVDLYSSTIAQLYLAELLDAREFGRSVFHHHRLLSLPDGNKLSKSAGATSISYLRKEGKKPADIYTLIGGWLGLEGTVNHWRDLAPVLLDSII